MPTRIREFTFKFTISNDKEIKCDANVKMEEDESDNSSRNTSSKRLSTKSKSPTALELEDLRRMHLVHFVLLFKDRRGNNMRRVYKYEFLSDVLLLDLVKLHIQSSTYLKRKAYVVGRLYQMIKHQGLNSKSETKLDYDQYAILQLKDVEANGYHFVFKVDSCGSVMPPSDLDINADSTLWTICIQG